eukprot:scaffold76144_cov32-Prasinocladus_malaysianus.AAC.2
MFGLASFKLSTHHFERLARRQAAFSDPLRTFDMLELRDNVLQESDGIPADLVDVDTPSLLGSLVKAVQNNRIMLGRVAFEMNRFDESSGQTVGQGAPEAANGLAGMADSEGPEGDDSDAATLSVEEVAKKRLRSALAAHPSTCPCLNYSSAQDLHHPMPRARDAIIFFKSFKLIVFSESKA